MLVTYNWLKEFVDITISPEELGDKLTKIGMEVEEIQYQDKYLKHVVVGLIKKIDKHPNAEKLTICTVDIGSSNVQIITAAKNINEGDYVPVSLPGADLANGIKIEKSVLRGEPSDGMFCSGEELGITDEYYKGASVNGILILHHEVKAGDAISDALGLNDVIFDVNVTSNRPDCMSIYGIAKEISAILRTPIKTHKFEYKTEEKENINKYLKVEVKNQTLCPRYMAAYVKDITVQDSPMWMKQRLNAVGIKSINNLVDITNYVLIEYGQPMHAFDYSHLDGNKIVVRNAKLNEKITCLNQNTYELEERVLAICDENKPVVIAGIIGGTNSCVVNTTSSTVLESACFERSNIRITSRKIGVRTDSTARFEKGVDMLSPQIGMQRALNLVYQLKVGKIVEGLIDIKAYEPENKQLSFSIERISRILGIKIPDEDILDILNNLGLTATINDDKLTCLIPVSRADIETDADIAEELIRVYGYDVYDSIESKLLYDARNTAGKYNDLMLKQNRLKEILCENGYYETLNFSICPANICDLLLFDKDAVERKIIRIENPLSEDISCLRTTIAHSLLNDISYNVKRNNKSFRLFEIGKVYVSDEIPLQKLPSEKMKLCFVSISENDDFFTFKGLLNKLLNAYDLEIKIERSKQPYLHPGISADVLCDGSIIASYGRIHPLVAKNYDIPASTLYAEIDLDMLFTCKEKDYAVKTLSKYPAVERDLAVVVKEEITCQDILDSVKKSCGDMLYDLYVFDIYRAQVLPEKKSIAFKYILSSQTKTLTDEDVNQVTNKILKDLKYKCGAELR